jgi:ATP-dependent Clp protease ATP-binding subunit ClpB
MSCCSSRSPWRRSSASSTLQIADLRRRLADRRPTRELTEDARALIAREGYDPVDGARPLRRFISHEVETRVGRALLAGDIADGATITLDTDGDHLQVRWSAPGEREAREAAAVAA